MNRNRNGYDDFSSPFSRPVSGINQPYGGGMGGGMGGYGGGMSSGGGMMNPMMIDKMMTMLETQQRMLNLRGGGESMYSRRNDRPSGRDRGYSGEGRYGGGGRDYSRPSPGGGRKDAPRPAGDARGRLDNKRKNEKPVSRPKSADPWGGFKPTGDEEKDKELFKSPVAKKPKGSIGDGLGVVGPKKAKLATKKPAAPKPKENLTKKESEKKEMLKPEGADVDFECFLCNVIFTKVEPYAKHCRGETHIKLVKDMAKRIERKAEGIKHAAQAEYEEMAKNLEELPEGDKEDFLCKGCHFRVDVRLKKEHYVTENHAKLDFIWRRKCDLCKTNNMKIETSINHFVALKHKKLMKGKTDKKDNIEKFLDSPDFGEMVKALAEERRSKDTIEDESFAKDDKKENVVKVADFTIVDECCGEGGDRKVITFDEKDLDFDKVKILKRDKKQIKVEANSAELVGTDCIETVEMLFCNLCHKFLPRYFDDATKKENCMKQHCLGATHKKRHAAATAKGNYTKFMNKASKPEKLDSAWGKVEETNGDAEMKEEVKEEVTMETEEGKKEQNEPEVVTME